MFVIKGGKMIRRRKRLFAKRSKRPGAVRSLWVLVLALAVWAATFETGTGTRADDDLVIGHDEAEAIDGDSIQVGGVVYDLAGIDAPELGQVCEHGEHQWLCGMASAYRLAKLLTMRAQPITCSVRPSKGSRPMVDCLIGDEDLSLVMLESGSAVTRHEAPGVYVMAERRAKEGGLGIWGSNFVPPEEWRTGKRLPSEHQFRGSSHPSLPLPWRSLEERFLGEKGRVDASCMIKGTLTDGGKRVFLVPLDPGFEETPDDGPGTRRFCSDEEAWEQGWRHKGEQAALTPAFPLGRSQ